MYTGIYVSIYVANYHTSEGFRLSSIFAISNILYRQSGLFGLCSDLEMVVTNSKYDTW